MTLSGRHPYEVSKGCADLIAQSYHHAYGLPVSIARCGNVYGGGDLNWSRLVPGTIRAFHNKQRPVIRSDGRSLRDYIYVRDVARAYLRLAECTSERDVGGEAFNFGTETPTSVAEMVDIIRRQMLCDEISSEILNVATGEIDQQYLCAAKARSILGWEPEFDLETGIQETIDWYGKYLADRVR